MLNRNSNHHGCSKSPEKVFHVLRQSRHAVFLSTRPLRTDSFAVKPHSTRRQSDDEVTMDCASSPHRHLIVTRKLLVLNDLQPSDDGDDENRFFSFLAPWQNTKNSEN